MIRVTRAFLPALRRSKNASIINITSIKGTQPPPRVVTSGIAWAAAMNFSKGLSFELAPNKIRVNVVSVGGILTPQMEAGRQRWAPEKKSRRIPCQACRERAVEAFGDERGGRGRDLLFCPSRVSLCHWTDTCGRWRWAAVNVRQGERHQNKAGRAGYNQRVRSGCPSDGANNDGQIVQLRFKELRHVRHAGHWTRERRTGRYEQTQGSRGPGRRHARHALAWSPFFRHRCLSGPSDPHRGSFAPGGAVDMIARLAAKYLTDELSQRVYVENKGGAGGSIGTAFVAKSDPDGYSLIMHSVSSAVMNSLVYKKLPYDILKDLTPIAEVAQSPTLLVINKDLPAKNCKSSSRC